MNVEFTQQAWQEFVFWIETDPLVAARIKELIQSIRQNPFRGLGKPEPLKHQLKGFWSRRIDREHRLVYRVSGTKGKDQRCSVIQCIFHYD